MENLVFTLNAVMPIILMVLLGYFLKKKNFFSEEFLKKANKLVFMVLIPSLLFYNIYSIQSFDEINIKFILFTAAGITSLFLIGLVLVILFIKDPKQKGVVLQCIFRSNYAIIGLPLAISLTGEGSLASILASLIAAVTVPLFNILSVIALSIFKEDKESKIDVIDILKKIVTNPLIISISAGLVVLLIRYTLVQGLLNSNFTIKDNIPFLFKTLESISRTATPLALIVLGANFTFTAVVKLRMQIIFATTMRTVVAPIIFLTLAYFLGLKNAEFPALIALFGTPVAVASVPMAAQMKADDELAGQLVVWTTISSAFTLFAIVYISRMLGIL